MSVNLSIYGRYPNKASGAAIHLLITRVITLSKAFYRKYGATALNLYQNREHSVRRDAKAEK